MLFYIDPGTGSMLFTILLGVISAGIYAFKSSLIKIKFLLNGGKRNAIKDEECIPYAIFSDSKRYWNVFKPICDEFEKRKTSVIYMTASEDDPAFDEQYEYVKREFIGDGNKAFAKLNMLKADVLLSTTPSLDVYQWKRSKDVKYYVHIAHAASDLTLYRMFGIDYYDAILISGEYQGKQIRELEKVRNLPKKELVMVGLPFMDTMKTRIDNSPQIAEKEKVVLLAPSWGPSSLLNVYGEKIIDNLIDTGYLIVIRPHPQSFTSEKDMIDRLMKKYPDGEKVYWNRDTDNFDILNRSSILISDFSGVMFDYALIFNKPVIYADTSFDKSPYDACWLDEELWTFRVLPTIGKKLGAPDIDNIKAIIDDCTENPKYEEGREKARQETWCNLGRGAVAVADYLIYKQHELKNEVEES